MRVDKYANSHAEPKERMDFIKRLLVMLIAMTMLVSGPSLSVFAESGDDAASVVASETAVSEETSDDKEAGGAATTEEAGAETADVTETEEEAAEEEAAGTETEEQTVETEAAEAESESEEELKLVKQTLDAVIVTEADRKKAEKSGESAAEIAQKREAKEAKEENGSDKDKDVTSITLNGKMPEGASASAEAVEPETKHDFFAAYDISIYQNDEAVADEEKWQPESEIKVEITDENLAKVKDGKIFHVYHIADNSNKPEYVCSVKAKDGKVSFKAESFSIYAIEEGGRLGYRFWYPDENGKYQLITTEYFRYADLNDGEDSLSIYSPKIPDVTDEEMAVLFKGWHKGTVNTEDGTAVLGDAVTIDELNTELKAKAESEFVEGNFVDVIAELNSAYYITYVDTNPNNVLATEFVTKESSGDTEFTVSSTAKPTKYEDKLIGWRELESITDASAQLYVPGEEYTIDSNITLAPVIEGGHWLVFNDNDLINGKSGGASYTAPQFHMDGEVTTKPADPEWTGYEFKGWYTDEACTDGNEFTFGQTLDTDTTVYAKWEASASSFTIIIWKQKPTDDPDADDDAKTYEYVSEAKITEDIITGMTVNRDPNYTSYTQIYGTDGTSSDADKVYFEFNDSKSDSSVTVKGDGSSVMNIYYDRKTVTMNFYTYSSDGYTYTQSNNGDYGKVGDTYVYLDESGWFSITYYYLAYPDGTPVPVDTTVYYPRSSWGSTSWYSTTTPSYNTTYYSDKNTGNAYKLTWENYSGTRYTRSSGSWQIYKTFTGLYGATLEDREYTWPSEYDWYDTGGSRGSTSGTRTTFLDAFSPVGDDFGSTTLTFYGSTPSGTKTIEFYKQQLDGTYPDEADNTVYSSGGSFNVSDKYTGFHAVQYRVDNGSWQDVGTKGSDGYYSVSPVSYRSKLQLRFERNSNNLNFITNNKAGDVVTVSDIMYGASLSAYADQSPGQNTGYYFMGWYEDEEFAVPFDFDSKTMGSEDMTVFGKWRDQRTRVVLVPVSDNGPNNVDMGSQALAFRLDYDERVDGGLMESATRPGYILDGWYTDPEFTNKFLFSSPVNADLEGVDMTYQTADKWRSARVNYGDDDEAHSNVRGILVLYARWIVDTDVKGANIVYDAGEAAITDAMGNVTTKVPIDHNFYSLEDGDAGNVEAIVKEAPTDFNELYEFKYWAIVNADGSLEPTELIPGQSTVNVRTAPAYTSVTDDQGNVIRKTILLRAVYEPTEEAKTRYTRVTYNGNTFSQAMYDGTTKELSGKTKDGSNKQSTYIDKEVNATIVLPGEDDFYLTGYKLTGWSFDEGNTQTKDFDLNQSVFANNLNKDERNNWDPNENTLYAMWEPKTYSVKVTQVVEDGVSDNSFTYYYGYGEYGHDESPSLPAASTSETLTGSNTSFDITDGTVMQHYDIAGSAFCIRKPTVAESKDYTVRVTARAKLDDGSTVTIDPYRTDSDLVYKVVGDIEVTVTYSPKVEVTFAKRDTTEKTKTLTGAVITLTPVEFNSDTQKWEDAGDATDITIDSSTVTRKLQEGSYRIVEKTAPDDYAKISDKLILTVYKDKDFTIRTESGADADEDVAALSKRSGSSYLDLLTLYDNPIRTITITKKVEGSTRLNGFDFTVTVSKMTDAGEIRLGNYDIGDPGDTHGRSEIVTNNVGVATISAMARTGGEESVNIRIPNGWKVEIEEDIYSNYITSYKVDDEEAEDGRKCIIDPANKNLTVEFTNVCIPAPTKSALTIIPFILMLLAAEALVLLKVSAKRRARARDTQKQEE